VNLRCDELIDCPSGKQTRASFFTNNLKPICIEEKQLREPHTCGFVFPVQLQMAVENQPGAYRVGRLATEISSLDS
jgi:hypothetical protein